MKFLNRLTISNLKENKKRTIMTIFAVVLSVSLIYTVLAMANIFTEGVKKMVLEEDGNFHIKTFLIDEKNEILNANKDVEGLYRINTLGYDYSQSKNTNKPYLKFLSANQEAFNSGDLKLLSGRFPMNDSEVVISDSIRTDAYIKFKIGDEIEANLSIRPDSIYEKGEQLEKIENKTYTVVGVIKRVNTSIEEYSDPGYSVFTLMSGNEKPLNKMAFYRLSDLSKIEEHISTVYGIDTKDIYNHIDKIRLNTRVFSVENNPGLNDGLVGMVFSLAILLVAVIIITSIVIIRNSISISIVRRTKEYGILKSIGATNSQVRNNVLFEGLFIGIIGTFIGLGLGILVTRVLTIIVQKLLLDLVTEFKISWFVPLFPLLVSGIIGILVILISSQIIARRAMKIAPITAIKGNMDINVSSKEVSTPEYIEKFFGIPGIIAYKNSKRNKKANRTTVISLAVSLAVFIGMSTLVGNLNKSIETRFGELNWDIDVNLESRNNEEIKTEELIKIANDNNIKEWSVISVFSGLVENEKINPEYIKYIENLANWNGRTSINVNLLDSNSYQEMLKDNNLPEDTKVTIFNSVRYSNNGKTIQIKPIIDLNIDLASNIDYENNKPVSSDIFNIPLELKEISKLPIGGAYSDIINIYMDENEIVDGYYIDSKTLLIKSQNPGEDTLKLREYFVENGISAYINNIEQIVSLQRNIMILINIFSFGFIIVISLIGLTNIYNTLNNNVSLRKMEYGTLRSLGMDENQFNTMTRYESIFITIKSILIGIVLGGLICLGVYLIVSERFDFEFYLPVYRTILVCLFMILLVYVILRSSVKRISSYKIIESLKNETV